MRDAFSVFGRLKPTDTDPRTRRYLTPVRLLQSEGDVQGAEQLLQPVMQSRLILPPGQDLYGAYRMLRALEEEDPMLHLAYDEEKKEITVQVMGRVQREILQRLILERFGMQVQDYL